MSSQPSAGSTGQPSTHPVEPPYPGEPQPGQPYTGGREDTAPRPPRRPVGAGFFDQIRAQGLVRSDDRVAAGVSGAVARRLGIDPILVRVGFVVLTLLGGIGVLAYGLGWLFLPQADGRIHAQSLLTGDVTSGAVGAVITVIVGIGGPAPPWAWGTGEFGGGGFFGVLPLLLLVALLIIGARRGWFRGSAGPTAPGGVVAERVDLTKPGATPPPFVPVAEAPPRPPRRPQRRTAGAFGALLAAGLAVVGAGAVVAADNLDPIDADVQALAWATALAVLAVCLAVVGLAGRRSGAIGALAVIALLGTTVSSVVPVFFTSDQTGQRSWMPDGGSDSYSYRLAAGEGVLDLTQLPPPSGPVDIRVDVGVGQLVVQVPDDLTVDVDVVHGIGDLAGVVEGRNSIGPAGPTDVNLSLDVSVGSIVVQQVSR